MNNDTNAASIVLEKSALIRISPVSPIRHPIPTTGAIKIKRARLG